MTGLILAMCLAPAAITVGLVLCRSAVLTFLFFYVGVCLLLPVLDAFIHNTSTAAFFKNYGFRTGRSSVVSLLLYGGFVFAAVFLLFSLLQGKIWDSTEISLVLSEWGINRMNPVVFVSVMVLANAFLEEFFWRGYIIHKLSVFYGNKTVILLSSAFYTSYHVITTGILFPPGYAAVSTVLVFGAGVLWGTVRVKTGSILFPLVTHLFIDLAIMAAYLKFLS